MSRFHSTGLLADLCYPRPLSVGVWHHPHPIDGRLQRRPWTGSTILPHLIRVGRWSLGNV
jgi:hypothetical protein